MSEQKVLPLRLSEDLVSRADALAERLANVPDLEALLRGGQVSRSTVLRLAIVKGMEVLEREYGKARRR